VRLELGPKDMKAESVMAVRRDSGTKEAVAWADLAERMPAVLREMQASMLERASARVRACMATVRPAPQQPAS
jgi:prolyl-tRNA synthetase